MQDAGDIKEVASWWLYKPDEKGVGQVDAKSGRKPAFEADQSATLSLIHDGLGWANHQAKLILYSWFTSTGNYLVPLTIYPKLLSRRSMGSFRFAFRFGFHSQKVAAFCLNSSLKVQPFRIHASQKCYIVIRSRVPLCINTVFKLQLHFICQYSFKVICSKTSAKCEL